MQVHRLMLTLMLCCFGSFADMAWGLEADKPQPREPAGQGTTPQLVIARHGDLLSVSARNTPWDVVLKKLEHQTGISIEVKGPLAGTLTQEFQALPLEQGLRKLFHGADVVFFYAPGPTASAAAEMLSRIWVFPKAGGAAQGMPGQRPPAGAAAKPPPPASAGKAAEALPSEEAVMPEGEAVAEEEREEHLKALEAFAQQGNTTGLHEALGHLDRDIQARALELLSEQDAPGAMALLVDMTRSEDPVTRLQALSLLYESSQADEGTRLAALSTALADGEASVKEYAIQALADRGGSEAMEYLRQAFRDPDPSVRMRVIESVAAQGEDLPLLQEALSDADETVRALAAFLLKQAIPVGQ